jgi:DNA-binding XRE family transcriptional regulator
MAHLVPDFAANVKWTPDATAAGERMIRKVTEGKLDPRAHSRVFARLVTRERKRRGWTQNHLAKKAKLSIRTVYLFENNLETRITLAAALRLAEVLGLQFRVWYDGSVGLV